MDCDGIPWWRLLRRSAETSSTPFIRIPHRDHIPRTTSRSIISSWRRKTTQRYQSSERIVGHGRKSKACRFRCGGTVDWIEEHQEHIRGYTFLDGTRSDTARRTRRKSRYLVAGYHCHRASLWTTTSRQCTPHESAVPDTKATSTTT